MTSTGLELVGPWILNQILSYGALHSRIHETVKIIQLQAHTKFKILNYVISYVQSSVAQIQGSSIRTTVLLIFSNLLIITTL